MARPPAPPREPQRPAPVLAREIEYGGERWTVRLEGATAAGPAPGACTPLLGVVFEGSGPPRDPELAAYVVAENLGEVPEDALRSLLAERLKAPPSSRSGSRRRSRSAR